MAQQHRNPAVEYVDAVDALTRPHQVAMAGPGGEHMGVRLEAPLLQTLIRDCAANVGRGAGAPQQSHARTPLNVGAADLLEAIRKSVLGDYAELVGGGARPDVAPALIAVRLPVLNRWRAGTLSDAALHSRTQRLKGWAQAIRDLLDPPMRIEVTAPCPRCGERWVVRGDGDMVGALSTTYREVAQAVTSCAWCHAQWEGIEGARRLSVEVDATARMQQILAGVA